MPPPLQQWDQKRLPLAPQAKRHERCVVMLVWKLLPLELRENALRPCRHLGLGFFDIDGEPLAFAINHFAITKR